MADYLLATISFLVLFPFLFAIGLGWNRGIDSYKAILSLKFEKFGKLELWLAGIFALLISSLLSVSIIY